MTRIKPETLVKLNILKSLLREKRKNTKIRNVDVLEEIINKALTKANNGK